MDVKVKGGQILKTASISFMLGGLLGQGWTSTSRTQCREGGLNEMFSGDLGGRLLLLAVLLSADAPPGRVREPGDRGLALVVHALLLERRELRLHLGLLDHLAAAAEHRALGPAPVLDRVLELGLRRDELRHVERRGLRLLGHDDLGLRPHHVGTLALRRSGEERRSHDLLRHVVPHVVVLPLGPRPMPRLAHLLDPFAEADRLVVLPQYTRLAHARLAPREDAQVRHGQLPLPLDLLTVLALQLHGEDVHEPRDPEVLGPEELVAPRALAVHHTLDLNELVSGTLPDPRLRRAHGASSMWPFRGLLV